MVSASEAAASLLLSPLSLYAWLASTLLRLVLSFPGLVLASARHSLLLLLAWPWSLLSVCLSLLLTCLRVALYLLHVATAVAAVAALTATAEGRKKTPEGVRPGSRLLGRRVVQQG